MCGKLKSPAIITLTVAFFKSAKAVRIFVSQSGYISRLVCAFFPPHLSTALHITLMFKCVVQFRLFLFYPALRILYKSPSFQQPFYLVQYRQNASTLSGPSHERIIYCPPAALTWLPEVFICSLAFILPHSIFNPGTVTQVRHSTPLSIWWSDLWSHFAIVPKFSPKNVSLQIKVKWSGLPTSRQEEPETVSIKPTLKNAVTFQVATEGFLEALDFEIFSRMDGTFTDFLTSYPTRMTTFHFVTLPSRAQSIA